MSAAGPERASPEAREHDRLDPPGVVRDAVYAEERLEARERFHRLKQWHRRAHANPVSALITKIIVTIIGGVLILAGIVMLIGPGQGVLAILLGLAVLATEYEWAERMLHRLRQRVHDAKERARAMDPKVRRRRIALTVLAVVAATALCVWAIARFGWPEFSIEAWNWMQNLAGFLPELPGM